MCLGDCVGVAMPSARGQQAPCSGGDLVSLPHSGFGRCRSSSRSSSYSGSGSSRSRSRSSSYSSYSSRSSRHSSFSGSRSRYVPRGSCRGLGVLSGVTQHRAEAGGLEHTPVPACSGCATVRIEATRGSVSSGHSPRSSSVHCGPLALSGVFGYGHFHLHRKFYWTVPKRSEHHVYCPLNVGKSGVSGSSQLSPADGRAGQRPVSSPH